MNRVAPRRIDPGCGRRRFSTLIAAEKAVERGADGTPEECRKGYVLHWHLHVAAPRLGFSDEVKYLTRVRAGHGDPEQALCEACALLLGLRYGEVQHRDARGMGGSKDPVTNSLAAAALLCGVARLGTGCHGKAESRDARMNEWGFWLREGQDPRYTPIRLYGDGGVRRWLSSDRPVYLDRHPRRAAA